jgi:hypothetical protein
MVKQAAPSLRSNIPQTALVAALDTYDFSSNNVGYKVECSGKD